jgi:hypothetical protein
MTPLISLVDDELLSATLMKNAEILQPWNTIGADRWIKAGRWWLLKVGSRSCTNCYTAGISTPTHRLPHVTLCRFCSGWLRSCSPCSPLTAPRRSQNPYYKLSTFNEGPETRPKGSLKCDHLHIHDLCLLKLPPGLCLVCQSTHKFLFSLGVFA